MNLLEPLSDLVHHSVSKLASVLFGDVDPASLYDVTPRGFLLSIIVIALGLTMAALIRAHLAKFKINFSRDVKSVSIVSGTRHPYCLVEVQGPWAM